MPGNMACVYEAVQRSPQREWIFWLARVTLQNLKSVKNLAKVMNEAGRNLMTHSPKAVGEWQISDTNRVSWGSIRTNSLCHQEEYREHLALALALVSLLPTVSVDSCGQGIEPCVGSWADLACTGDTAAGWLFVSCLCPLPRSLQRVWYVFVTR